MPKSVKKIPKKILTLCKKLKIRVTIKHGGKRVYKKLSDLKKQIKKKQMAKRKYRTKSKRSFGLTRVTRRRRSHFGIASVPAFNKQKVFNAGAKGSNDIKDIKGGKYKFGLMRVRRVTRRRRNRFGLNSDNFPSAPPMDLPASDYHPPLTKAQSQKGIMDNIPSFINDSKDIIQSHIADIKKIILPPGVSPFTLFANRKTIFKTLPKQLGDYLSPLLIDSFTKNFGPFIGDQDLSTFICGQLSIKLKQVFIDELVKGLGSGLGPMAGQIISGMPIEKSAAVICDNLFKKYFSSLNKLYRRPTGFQWNPWYVGGGVGAAVLGAGIFGLTKLLKFGKGHRSSSFGKRKVTRVTRVTRVRRRI